MSVILEDRPTIAIQPPADPELATLWRVAVAKVRLRRQATPSMKADWNEVTREYNALSTKLRGPISAIIRERCEKAPGFD